MTRQAKQSKLKKDTVTLTLTLTLTPTLILTNPNPNPIGDFVHPSGDLFLKQSDVPFKNGSEKPTSKPR